MRIEGFISLIGCVMLLFVLSFAVGALTREVSVLIPDTSPAKAEPLAPPSP